jgi:hypothetical protein
MVWVLTKVRRKGERRRRPMSAVAISPIPSFVVPVAVFAVSVASVPWFVAVVAVGDSVIVVVAVGGNGDGGKGQGDWSWPWETIPQSPAKVFSLILLLGVSMSEEVVALLPLRTIARRISFGFGRELVSNHAMYSSGVAKGP